MKTKFLFFFGLILFSSNCIFGQINQGAFMVGGSTYFNYNIPKGGSGISMFNISPNAGVFIVENMAIGAALDFSLTNGSSNLSIAPFMRAYYKDQFYGQLKVGYGRYSSNFGGGTSSSSSYTGLKTEFDLGYTIFLTEQIAIDPALYYNFYMNSGKYGGSNLGMKLGFQIFLNHN